MFNLFGRKKQAAQLPIQIDALRLQINPNWKELKRDASLRLWQTQRGDGISVNFYPIPPDIPSNLRSIDDLRAVYTQHLDPPSDVIEAEILSVAGLRTVRLIIQIAKKPHGFTYIGTYTFPFEAFSFVVWTQCDETGVTGMREAVLFDQWSGEHEDQLQQMHIENIGSEGVLLDFDPTQAQYDHLFPEHPLSRLRQLQASLSASVSFDPAVLKCAPLRLPEPAAWARNQLRMRFHKAPAVTESA